jgi:hypothetical protein
MMTEKQALAEARKRWGKDAVVRCNLKHPVPNWRYAVGHAFDFGIGFKGGFMIEGDGASWEEAFANADKGSVGQQPMQANPE